MPDTPYPLPRAIRQSDILAGDGGATYGPFAYKIFDIEDVAVYRRAAGSADAWAAADFTAAKATTPTPLELDDFTITFAAAIDATTEFIVVSERLHERTAAITRGGALSGQLMEKELSKQGSVLQEQRRDIDRAVKVDYGADAQALPAPEADHAIGWVDGKLANVPNGGPALYDAVATAQAAQTGAVAARTGAETARTGAETARTAAEALIADPALVDALFAKSFTPSGAGGELSTLRAAIERVHYLPWTHATAETDYGNALDDAVALQASDQKQIVLQSGTFAGMGPVALNGAYQIAGHGYRNSVVTVAASTDPFFNAPGGAGSGKHIGGGVSDLKVQAVGPASNPAQGMNLRGQAYTVYRNVEVWNFQTACKLEGGVGARFENVFLSRGKQALLLSGPSSSDQNTVTNFTGGKLDIAETLIKFSGMNYYLSLDNVVFENFSKLLEPVTPGTDFLAGLYIRGGHIESFGTGKVTYTGDTLATATPSDDKIDMTGAIAPIISGTRISGSFTVTGAVYPRLRDVVTVASTGYPTAMFSVTGDAFELSIAQPNVANFTGNHGLLTTKPVIGSVETYLDKDYVAGTAESLLLGQAGGFFGFSEEGFQNLFTSPDTTAYPGANIPYWPTRTATVTGGQTTCTGQTDGVLIQNGYVNATGWSAAVPGAWYAIEVAWNAVAVDDIFRVEIYSQGGGALRKKISFKMRDTGMHHRFIPFLADYADTRFYLAHDGGTNGIKIHRIQLHSGARVRPFLNYRQTVAGAFKVDAGLVTDFGDTIPAGTDGKIGDKRLKRTPVAGGTIGWVKTGATTWKTFGAIAA